jgi:hypothetical protein
MKYQSMGQSRFDNHRNKYSSENNENSNKKKKEKYNYDKHTRTRAKPSFARTKAREVCFGLI